MGERLHNVVKGFSEKGGIFMFLRAQLSSQLASITDFGISFILKNFFGTYYVYATAIGAFCGGIINCIINYKWTFKAQGVEKKYVAYKYVLVWMGSLLFNTVGVYFLTELLGKWEWLESVLRPGIYANLFIISKAIVSLIVGFVWNYNMQRLFVYKNVNIKHFFFGDRFSKEKDDSK